MTLVVTMLTHRHDFWTHNDNMRKKDSSNGTYFRAGDRVFCQNGSWFFQTRENDHGPFSTRDAAQLDLKRYIEEMSFFDSVTPGVPVKPATAKQSDELRLLDKD